jgi:hypothetical protein
MVVMTNSGADVPGTWVMMQDVRPDHQPETTRGPGLPKQ